MAVNTRAAILAVLLILAVIASAYFVTGMLTQMAMVRPAAPPAPVYSENLVAYFRIINGTSGAAITSGVVAELYPADANPFARAVTEQGEPIAIAVYDSDEGAWALSGVDAGSYKLLVYVEGSTNTYPVLIDVEVPATTRDDLTTWLDPQVIYMYTRAAIAIDTEIRAWNESTNAWDTVTQVNFTQGYTRWKITYEISIYGHDRAKVFGPIRFYFSDIDAIEYTDVCFDGKKMTLAEDTSTREDALTGLYFEVVEDFNSGETHMVVIEIVKAESIGASTTLTMTMADLYSCQNPDLKWWSYSSASVTITP